MKQETATLILNTFDINPSQTAADYYNQTIDNQYGTITNNRCNITWKNINMRQLLGKCMINMKLSTCTYIKLFNQVRLVQCHLLHNMD